MTRHRAYRSIGGGAFAGLVDALDADYAADAADINEDGFELALVGDFETGFDAGVEFVWAAFEIADVGAGAADDSGDFGEQAGAVLGADGELYRERRSAVAAPFDGDAAFRLIQQVLHVGTALGVHSHAASARNVADDFVAGNGVATFGAIDKQIVLALDDQRSFAKAEHTLDGFYQRGLGVDVFDSVVFRTLTKHAGENLARGIFSKTYGGVQIFNLGDAQVRGDLEHVGFGN